MLISKTSPLLHSIVIRASSPDGLFTSIESSSQGQSSPSPHGLFTSIESSSQGQSSPSPHGLFTSVESSPHGLFTSIESSSQGKSSPSVQSNISDITSTGKFSSPVTSIAIVSPIHSMYRVSVVSFPPH